MSKPEERFSYRQIKVTYGIAFGFFLMLQLSSFADPIENPVALWTDIAFSAVLVVLFIRSIRAGTILLTRKHLVLRGLLSTRRLPRAQVEQIVVTPEQVGFASRRNVLVFKLHNGKDVHYNTYSRPISGGTTAMEQVAQRFEGALGLHNAPPPLSATPDASPQCGRGDRPAP